MSFSSDLWNGFDLILSNFKSKHKEWNNLLYFFNQLSNLQSEYSEGLRILHMSISPTLENSTLGLSLKLFFDTILKESQVHKEQFQYITEKIIPPLKEVITNQQSEIESLYKCNNQNVKEIDVILSSWNDKKNTFHSSAKKWELSVINLEISKKNEKLSKRNKNSYINSHTKASTEAKKAQMDYLNHLDFANYEREVYNNNTKKILNNLENIYINTIDFLKWTLCSYEESQIKNLSKTWEIASNNWILFKEINSKADTKEFIEANATKLFPYYTLEFIPYKINNSNIKDIVDTDPSVTDAKHIDIDKSFINSIKKQYNDELQTQVNVFENNQDNNQVYEEINTIVKQMWANNNLDPAKKENILWHIKKKNNFKYFLKTINHFRSHGQFLIAEGTYKMIVEIFNTVFDDKNYQKEYDILKNIIIWSQTFYLVTPEIDKKSNVLLQNGIQTHWLWKKKETWEEIIKYSIGQQDRNRGDIGNYDNESKDARDKRLSWIAYNTVVTFTCNMISFGLDKSWVHEVNDFFCKVYNISEDDIMGNVEEYVKANESHSLIANHKNVEGK